MHVRKPTGTDVSFIKDSWLRSFERSYHVKRIAPPVYRYHHSKIADKLLGRAETLIGCDPADPWIVWGWITGEWDGNTLCLHYAYVKELARGMRVASKLFETLVGDREPEALVYTHDSPCTKGFLAGLEAQGLIQCPTLYNPYLMYP
jgi:hypothetical protein